MDASAAKEARGLPAADRAGLMGRPSRLRGEAGLISPSMLQCMQQRSECSVLLSWHVHVNCCAACLGGYKVQQQQITNCADWHTGRHCREQVMPLNLEAMSSSIEPHLAVLRTAALEMLLMVRATGARCPGAESRGLVARYDTSPARDSERAANVPPLLALGSNGNAEDGLLAMVSLLVSAPGAMAASHADADVGRACASSVMRRAPPSEARGPPHLSEDVRMGGVWVWMRGTTVGGAW